MKTSLAAFTVRIWLDEGRTQLTDEGWHKLQDTLSDWVSEGDIHDAVVDLLCKHLPRDFPDCWVVEVKEA